MQGDALQIPFVDLNAQYEPLKADVLDRWKHIVETTNFISGHWVEQFERGFAGLHGVNHCVAVANGTDAIELALRALNVQVGDEVILPTNTFIATAEAVSNVGAKPVLVDCNDYSNIDTSQIESALSSRTVGVIGVHLYGNPADFDEISLLAQRHGLWTLEDAAQGHLAKYKGRAVGSLGDIAAFSFYPAKNLGAPGEGGAVTTNSSELAEHVRKTRNHGQSERYFSDIVGGNSRMSELVASVLELKLAHIENWTAQRRKNADRYYEMLKDCENIDLIPVQNDRESCYHLFVVHVDGRDPVRQMLADQGISTGLHYPVPIHLQNAYSHLGYRKGAFPNSEYRATRMISLPMYAELKEREIDYVCAALRQACV
jgi:dTDP-4-amino-4,6-dideoxygalactose transaminase